MFRQIKSASDTVGYTVVREGRFSIQATLPGMPPAVMPGPQLHARRPPSDPGLVSALQSLQTMFPPGAAQNDPNTVARAAAQLLGQNGLAALQNMMGATLNV